ncbi:helix-turn-helix domain-containing protein [Streptomyces sp. RKAG337]|uniref:helix-turn-helix domain-containing protein n=1 Tax=Streptomyces sp. RKAG337 TaxID=2893404 RepID=UPI0020336EBE|nr:helix-turn-helix transcriptional regulator [Streptomyces sp. RKAG337]MCM2430075.1 helix-turn-helix domain-containing protein [Streptomyces sp. RKAG337]
MSPHVNPTVGRRRLGSEFRALRQSRGLTAQQVAKQLLVSQAKISLLENGRRKVNSRDVRDLCEVYEVQDPQVVDALMRMAEESGQSGWWKEYGDIPHSVYIDLETDAAAIRCYESMVIPELLQTPAYARAVIAGTIPHATAEQIGTWVHVRLRRQWRVDDLDHALHLWIVLDESALRRVVGGGEVMREQLERLLDLGGRPHVTVQVIPHHAGAHPGMAGRFSIVEFADVSDRNVVYLEGLTSDLYLEKPPDVQRYGVIYESLQARALDPVASGQLVTDVIKSYIGAEFQDSTRPDASPSPGG